jgi:hypothetical protein
MVGTDSGGLETNRLMASRQTIGKRRCQGKLGASVRVFTAGSAVQLGQR